MGLWSAMKALFTGDHFSEEVWESWEDVLIEADFGYQNAVYVLQQVRQQAKDGRIKTVEQLRNLLHLTISGMVAKADLDFDHESPKLILFLGVNGVGKTTSLAKVAHWYQTRGVSKIVLAAGDTFRSAATDQIKVWGDRLGLRVISQGHGADPGAVIFDAIASAQARGDELILADSAGRLHNKTNLVSELMKIDKVVKGKLQPEAYRKLLVIDTVTGQNALQQTEIFHEAVGLDALVLSKWDSSAKGGAVLSIARKLGIGVAFVGVGEKAGDLKEFDPGSFADAVLGA